MCVKNLFCQLGAFPIPLGHAWSRGPDLPDFTWPALDHCAWIGDDDLLIQHRMATTNQGYLVLRFQGSLYGLIFAQSGGVEIIRQGSGRNVTAGDHQRALGQAITWIERLPPETMGSERFGKVIERFQPDRFCTAESDIPATQIKTCPLFRRYFVDAHLVGEIGRAAYFGPVLAYRLQPTDRSL